MENIPPRVNVKMTSTARSPGDIEKTYQKKTQLEHILLRPDTYIGSVESETEQIWVLNESNQMELRKITFVPGLYKIFDEILVNAADNKQRDPQGMTSLKVDIDREKGFVSIYNNGKGIPVTIHKEHLVYVPDLIFGHLLTSSHYDDEQQKTTGGRNGYGAKLANIFSTRFVVETQDQKHGKLYKQVFEGNMSKKKDPVIIDSNKPDWTRITFYPDFSKFGMKGFDDDIVALFKKRVYDIAGVSDSSLKVTLNGEKVPINGFQAYVDLYFPLGSELPKLFVKINERWEICVSMTDGHFQQVSFVNAICTTRGGKHVTAIADQVCKAIGDHVQKKDKSVNLKPQHIKNHLWIFVKSLITNPAFDSQTKDTLTTKPASFGSECKLGPDFLKNVLKSGIIENVLSYAKFKQSKDLKKHDGKKKTRLSGIAKLDDANDAGGRNAQDCTLILTEGDSAKSLAVAGLAIVGRDKYGVFPLRGKPLNVRDASHKQIMANTEVTCLKQILGLAHGKVYEDTKSLRYGHVMIMTDQDHDGSHIKGLLINFFQKFWPELFKMRGFLQEFITPIVKAFHPSKPTLEFFTIPEYVAWKEANANGKGWKVKYYKGLGTSTAKEGKKYFSHLEKHVINFRYSDEHKISPELAATPPPFELWPDDKLVEMAFSRVWMKPDTKKKWGLTEADVRKHWIAKVTKNTFLDQKAATKTGLKYNDFFNKELILFSKASNERAIPQVMDGLKPGQRKILFTCFKRNLLKEIKVAQLAGNVGEKSAYHHGEASLTATIVNLAQNFVGANNINLLMPNGQFGTRLQGGKDSASARYIFTNLAKVTRYIFPEVDDAIFPQLNDDGLLVEPFWYAPVVPMVLINGSSGIGTGWSSTIPNFNPRELVKVIKCKLEGKPFGKLVPWYKGFTGVIEKATEDKFWVHGIVSRLPESLSFLITELPIGWWTSDYKMFLESLIEKGVLSGFKEYHATNTISFAVTLTSEQKVAEVEAEGFHKVFKLSSSLATSNMVLYDHEGNIRQYSTPEEILDEFFTVRLKKYHERKKYLEGKLSDEVRKYSNKVRFILAVIKEEIKLRNEPKANILAQLERDKYDRFPKQKKKQEKEVESEDDEEVAGDENEVKVEIGSESDFDYLLSMPLWSLTKEKVKQLQKMMDEKKVELKEMQGTTPEVMWVRDLDKFEEKLEEHEQQESEGKSGKKRKKKGFDDSDDSDDAWDGDSKPKKKGGKKALVAPVALEQLEIKKDFNVLKKGPRVRKSGMKTEGGEDGDGFGFENGDDSVIKENGTPKKKKRLANPNKVRTADGEVKEKRVKKEKVVKKEKYSSDLDVSDPEGDFQGRDSDVPVPRADRPQRARKTVKYIEGEDEDEFDQMVSSGDEDEITPYEESEEEEEEEEEKPVPVKKATKPPVKAKKEEEEEPVAVKKIVKPSVKVKKEESNFFSAPPAMKQEKQATKLAPIFMKKEKAVDKPLPKAKVAPKEVSDSEEEMPMSLMSRVEAKSGGKTAEAKPAKKNKYVFNSEDDLEDISEPEASESDYEEGPKKKVAKKPALKRPTVPKPLTLDSGRLTPSKKPKVSKGENGVDGGKPKKVQKPKTKTGADSNDKPKAKRPSAPKQPKVIYSDEEGFGSDAGFDASEVTKKTPRPARARQAVNYADPASAGESDFELSD